MTEEQKLMFEAELEKLGITCEQFSAWIESIIDNVKKVINLALDAIYATTAQNPKHYHLYKHAKRYRTRKKYRNRFINEITAYTKGVSK